MWFLHGAWLAAQISKLEIAPLKFGVFLRPQLFHDLQVLIGLRAALRTRCQGRAAQDPSRPRGRLLRQHDGGSESGKRHPVHLAQRGAGGQLDPAREDRALYPRRSW